MAQPNIGALSAPYDNHIREAARRHGMPEPLLRWLLYKESTFNPNAKNGNATGIAQFMPGTAREMGIDPTDPVQSIYGAARYAALRTKQAGGDWIRGLKGYGTISNARDEANARSVLQTGVAADGTSFGGQNGGFIEWFQPRGGEGEPKGQVGVEIGPGGSADADAPPPPRQAVPGEARNRPPSETAWGMPFGFGNVLVALQDYAGRVALLLLALVVIAAALFLLGKEAVSK